MKKRGSVIREQELESGSPGFEFSIPRFCFRWVPLLQFVKTKWYTSCYLEIFDHEHCFQSDYVHLQHLLRFVYNLNFD